MKNKKPKAFGCYLDNYTILEHLSDSQAGQLWKMLFRLALNSERENCDDPMVDMAYALMAQKLESDFESYSAKIEKLRENGRKKAKANLSEGEQKEATAEDEKQTEAKAGNCSQYKDEYKDEYEDKDEDKDEDEYEDEDEDEYEEEEKIIKKEACAPCSAAASAAALFRECCPDLPPAPPESEVRERLLRKLPPIDLRQYFLRVQRSDFLTGRSGKWLGCTLDWLLRPDTVQKVMSGTYDNRESPPVYPTMERSYRMEDIDRIDTLDFID